MKSNFISSIPVKTLGKRRKNDPEMHNFTRAKKGKALEAKLYYLYK